MVQNKNGEIIPINPLTGNSDNCPGLRTLYQQNLAVIQHYVRHHGKHFA
jgi:hypothetical protein